MKKHFGIIIAFFILIGLVEIPGQVSANIKQNDLGGKIYLMTTGHEVENRREAIFFNPKGNKYFFCSVQTDGNGTIIKPLTTSKKRFNSMINDPNGFKKNKDEVYSIKTDGGYGIKGNKIQLINDDEPWARIKGDDPDHFEAAYKYQGERKTVRFDKAVTQYNYGTVESN